MLFRSSGQAQGLRGAVIIAFDASTTFDDGGDLLSFDAIADAFEAGSTVEIDGDGTTQPDGSILATSVKAETKD